MSWFNECDCCGEQIVGTPVVFIKEINTSNDGIEADVLVERRYCSNECKTEME